MTSGNNAGETIERGEERTVTINKGMVFFILDLRPEGEDWRIEIDSKLPALNKTLMVYLV